MNNDIIINKQLLDLIKITYTIQDEIIKYMNWFIRNTKDI